MRGGFRFVSTALICGVLLVRGVQAREDSQPPSSRIAARKHARKPTGEIAVDVTVRSHPRLTAHGITDLTAGTPVRSVRSKALGWTRIVEPMRGWIPSEAYAVRTEDAERRATIPTPDPENPDMVASSSREHRSHRRHHHRHRPAPEESSAIAGDDVAPEGEPAAADLAATTLAERRPPGAAPSDSDLMLDALTATRGESPNAARIARVVAETAEEAKRKRIDAPQAMAWKDPFVDDSEPPSPVRSRRGRRARGGRAGGESDGERVRDGDHDRAGDGDGDRDRDRDRNRMTAGAADERSEARTAQAELIEARREAARARAETAAARAEAAATRAEAARFKAELARREAAAARAEAVAAKREAEEARADCDEPGERRRASWRESELHDGGRAQRVHKSTHRQAAAKGGGPSGVAATAGDESPAEDATAPRGLPQSTAAAVPPPEVPAPTAPPPVSPQPSSASDRGILVVPLN